MEMVVPTAAATMAAQPAPARSDGQRCLPKSVNGIDGFVLLDRQGDPDTVRPVAGLRRAGKGTSRVSLQALS
jgi:hypothetical protein